MDLCQDIMGGCLSTLHRSQTIKDLSKVSLLSDKTVGCLTRVSTIKKNYILTFLIKSITSVFPRFAFWLGQDQRALGLNQPVGSLHFWIFKVVLWDPDIRAMWSLPKCEQSSLIKHLLYCQTILLNWTVINSMSSEPIAMDSYSHCQ